jgi:hypothetical protein
MDGDLALWYARSRKKSSDFDRGRRSQDVLRALYARSLQTDTFSKIPELYTAFINSVITDLSLADVLQLVPLAGSLGNADIRSYYIGRNLVSNWTTQGGASVLQPNGPAIQSMLQQALAPADPLPEVEAMTIEVRNGTTNTGWDALAAERLNFAGYNTRLAAAERQDFSTTWLYDLSPSGDPESATPLLAILGLQPAAYISAPTQADVPFVLIVGADYQPCFNPESLIH